MLKIKVSKERFFEIFDRQKKGERITHSRVWSYREIDEFLKNYPILDVKIWRSPDFHNGPYTYAIREFYNIEGRYVERSYQYDGLEQYSMFEIPADEISDYIGEIG